MVYNIKGKVESEEKKRSKQSFSLIPLWVSYYLFLVFYKNLCEEALVVTGFLMTGKRSKTTCRSVSHKLFKDKAKNRVDDLQGMLLDLQFARKESSALDVTLLEEQVNLMLREWKSELNEPSPASSLQQVIIIYYCFILVDSCNMRG